MRQDEVSRSLYLDGVKIVRKRGYAFVSEAAAIFNSMCAVAAGNIAKRTGVDIGGQSQSLKTGRAVTTEFVDAFIYEAKKDKVKKIGVAHIERARSTLCPLFPFC